MKRAYFYIDDVIWLFRDLTRQRPASLFDNPFLALLEKCHRLYGAKFQLNVFYRTDFYYGDDEFTLAEMTDAYRAEFEAASQWLKLGFHSKQEFPDYPFINASYADARAIFERIRGEIFRFAGEKTFAYGVTPHWGPISREACIAFRDCGAKVLWASYGPKEPYCGGADALPYGHAGRLLQNRQPETMLYHRGTMDVAIDRSICGYNHLSQEVGDALFGTLDTYTDPATGIRMKPVEMDVTVNLMTSQNLDARVGQFLDREYLCIDSHEQYFYPDYYAYQPDYAAKTLRACELAAGAGYTFFFLEELGE